eukprot:4638896-Pyramimonas_sp.AAC.1
MLRTFVDDAVLRVESPESVVGDLLVEFGCALCNDFGADGLTVSPKTVVISSSDSLSLKVSNGLRRAGVPVTAVRHA